MEHKRKLSAKIKEAQETLKYLNNVMDELINGELSLRDIIAEQEQLNDFCEDLKNLANEIIELRQLIDLNETYKSII